MSKDLDLEKIKEKKIADMLQRAEATSVETRTNRPLVLTDDSFFSEVAKCDLMLVDFWAPWCGPCRTVGPLIEELASEYAGKVTFGKMNVDDNQVVARSFNVMTIPTLMVFKGGKLVETIV